MPTEDGGAGMNVAETAVANWQPLHYAGFDERRDDAVVLCLLNQYRTLPSIILIY